VGLDVLYNGIQMPFARNAFVASMGNERLRSEARLQMKYWEITADKLSKAGWSWGCVSAVDTNGRTIFVADAHRGGSLNA